MKTPSQPPRTPSRLSDSVHHQLNVYALAAGAAGVGLLASALPSEAKIVYTHAYHVIRPRHSFQLDLNHDGVPDFTIRNLYVFYYWGAASVQAAPARRNRVEGAPGFGGIPSAYALTRGSKIGPRKPFSGQLMAYYGTFNTLGRWINVRDGYLGLRFQIRGKTHYGWARLNVSFNGDKFLAVLTGYAYETVANQPIIAGKEQDGDESVEQLNPTALAAPALKPATLGALARGSSGLSIWRREESVGATQ